MREAGRGSVFNSCTRYGQGSVFAPPFFFCETPVARPLLTARCYRVTDPRDDRIGELPLGWGFFAFTRDSRALTPMARAHPIPPPCFTYHTVPPTATPHRRPPAEPTPRPPHSLPACDLTAPPHPPPPPPPPPPPAHSERPFYPTPPFSFQA